MLKYVECPGLPRGVSFSSDAGDRVAIRPLGLLTGSAAAHARNGLARPLAGGPVAFTACEVFVECGGTVNHCVSSVSELDAWVGWEGGDLSRAVNREMERLTGARMDFAGLTPARTRIFGIVNVTPDSFHDGGRHGDADTAIAHGEALIEAGADAIDVGGESTRPGSEETPEEVELERVLPVIRALRGKGAVLSVDTRRATVMEAALDAGAEVVNDVTALRDDPDALAVVAEKGASVILMHMQGRPRSMQDRPRYGHAPYEVGRFLKDRVDACTEAGIPIARIAVDPGVGFGKTVAHNLQLLSAAGMLHGTGAQVMVGASRKSFIGRIFGDVPSDARLPGSLAAAMMAVSQGVQLLRVHDVAETRQALAIVEGCMADGPVAQ
jgi:dihydropteroate synthase